jgi:hypothetical protein
VSRTKRSYVIQVYYPETEEKMLELRKRMGRVYIEWVRGYIKTLPISIEDKNILYKKVNANLIGNLDK